ncbi:unnamed protein product, partial [Allacma fusca]
MFSFAKYSCILSICNLLLLHGILSAPNVPAESLLDQKQHQECLGTHCWNGNHCVPCGSGGGYHCPQGLIWDGNHCVGSGAG